ncbi:hypothetical protein [Psychromonas sp. L1A2]|uniref:hypothetical protein n=1 Tax=Psychromonas sp. L1A2 TaxID=2686356 RepID=UPI00135A1ECC|nr:hypothetical protein [Psychromonas sp. L1A2]
MNAFLNILLYRHRRFEGETYFRNKLPLMIIISAFFSMFIADTFYSFLMTTAVFIFIDMAFAFGAWLYYKTDL